MTRSRRLIVALTAVLGLSTSQAWATGWQAVTLVSVGAGNYGGAIVTFQISGTYDNSGGCATPTAYTIRDPASLNQELAVLMAAFIAGHTVNVYVTGSCDSDNNPSVIGVTIQ